MTNKTPNWQNLNLENQCGVCIYYLQRIVEEKETARGNCELSGKYKQRTESCLKYKPNGGQEND